MRERDQGTADGSETYTKYEAALVERLWSFAEKRFPQVLDSKHKKPGPPVFIKDAEDCNVLAQDKNRRNVMDKLPRESRHIWFRSMKSSQALAQSVFGNLIVSEKLEILQELKDGVERCFPPEVLRSSKPSLEHDVGKLLNEERRHTEVDFLLDGPYRVAVECKLREEKVGSCSRAKKPKDKPECDGLYSNTSCKRPWYWKFIPELFNWDASSDHSPCPLNSTYQLVRNILAACVKDGKADPRNGHAVLLYDDRNPEFHEGGKAHRAVCAVRAGLKDKRLLRLCTWQQIVELLDADEELNWLAKQLREKYGF